VSMVWPTLGSRTAKEQNRTYVPIFSGLYLWTSIDMVTATQLLSYSNSCQIPRHFQNFQTSGHPNLVKGSETSVVVKNFSHKTSQNMQTIAQNVSIT